MARHPDDEDPSQHELDAILISGIGLITGLISIYEALEHNANLAKNSHDAALVCFALAAFRLIIGLIETRKNK
ncbi:MAG TPA: hypothetical protein VLH19_02675 [Patescibacteria group bacterium]|nr:hypothetical protein [Patescibacteria group bacterium]